MQDLLNFIMQEPLMYNVDLSEGNGWQIDKYLNGKPRHSQPRHRLGYWKLEYVSTYIIYFSLKLT